jgi:dipeptidyl aminopeptidase
VAVAPVTNWLFYDSIYTERYMNTPSLNVHGYNTASVLNVTAFNNVNFLLAHGSGDDNVHYMNSASLLDKFTQEKVRGFRFRMFTDRYVFLSCVGSRKVGWELTVVTTLWILEGLIGNCTK